MVLVALDLVQFTGAAAGAAEADPPLAELGGFFASVFAALGPPGIFFSFTMAEDLRGA